MSGSAVKYWVLLAMFLVAIYGSYVAARHLRSENQAMVGPAIPIASPTSKPKGPPLTSFTLTDQDGKPFDSRALDGKVWVASYFFVNCPGTCWRLNQALQAIQAETPGSDVRYVSITCDPENDTPEALKTYAQHFKADPTRWTFVTGPLDLVQRIGQDMFQISVAKASHTDRACVVDRQGKVRGRFLLTDPQQVELLKKLLQVVEAEAVPAPGGDPPSETPPTDAEATPQATSSSSSS
jgi:cytochrome oxidase Cu insertion factor (SCO1/SenC/PrrC family)